MKVRNILLLIIATIFLSSEAFGSNGFFRNWKLSIGAKLAIDDYTRIIKEDTLLVMNINKNDSLSFTLDGNMSSIESFINNPPFYYSIYKKHIILIYNGDEINYYPNPTDLALMYNFLSKYIDTSEFINCDWENYTFTIKLKSTKYDIIDQVIIQYEINNDSIIKKDIFRDSKIDDYSKRRFKPKYIKGDKQRDK